MTRRNKSVILISSMKAIHKKIHKYLQACDKAAIIPHINPDGDALGAAGAMAEYLKKMGKEAVIFSTRPANCLRFLPNLHLIENKREFYRRASEFKTIITVDCGDLKRAGLERWSKKHDTVLINIDHHATNDGYGDINLVDPASSSTTQILYNLFKHNRIRLNRDSATSLLAGILSDTDNFTNSATTRDSVLIAGDLIRQGGNLVLINKKIRYTSFKMLKLWGLVLDRLENVAEKNMGYTYITREDCVQHEIDEKETEGLANFLNMINGIKIGAFLKETADGKIKVSLRTVHDDTDVSALAQKFGGGGHEKAAGFTVDGTIRSVLDKLIAII